MKVETVIGKGEEKVVIYLNERSSLIESIEKVVESYKKELTGYKDSEIYKLSYLDAEAYSVEDGRVYAYIGEMKLSIKERLYIIEEIVGDVFVKINQSCIVNISRIKKFETSIGGSVRVVTEGGFKDYISRRQLRTVKERLGF